MRLRFTKMHGLGNDFVVVDGITQKVRLNADKIRFLADRHFGVGCAQVLLVEVPSRPEVDFRYRIFNADGGEVENCGNGARCFARFVRERKLTGKRDIRVETAGGDMLLKVTDGNQVEVAMGVPRLAPDEIPFKAEAESVRYDLAVTGAQGEAQTLDISALSMGNPHAVLLVNQVDSAPVAELGPAIERHPRLPRRANAGFMQIVSPREIRLRVFERGSGETLACGSGACAAVVAGRLRQLLEEEVKVHLLGGSLTITWPGPGSQVVMTGPATTVFHGQVKIP